MAARCRQRFLVAAAQVPLWGHHSVSGIFDSKMTIVKGTMTKVEWVNPHIFVFVTGDNKEWKFESSPPAFWRSVGVRSADFAKGISQQVTIEAQPARSAAPYGYLRKITFANGDFLEATNAN